MMKTLVVVPCYNEGKHIGKVVGKLKKYKLDILVVDDGSNDGCCNDISSKGVRVVRLKKNKGKGIALATGFSYAVKKNFDAVVTIDADGQHNPSDIRKFLENYGKAEIIIGKRALDTKHMPLSRVIANKLSSLILSFVCGQKIPDSQSGFRLVKTSVLRSIKIEENGYMAETELLIKASRKGFRIGHVPIETIYGRETSHINPFLAVSGFCYVVLRNTLYF
jgi:glycosyltransferase involved in cell wall biosynthesis